MATQIPISFANVRYVFQCNGIIAPMGFSIGTDVGAGETAATISAATTDAFDDVIWTAGTSASNQYTFVGVEVTQMTGTGPVVASSSLNRPGTLATTVPPSNLAMLVTKVTGQGGRKNRGRMYIPTAMLFETEVDHSGRMAAGTVTAWQNKWNAFLNRLQTDALQPWLFHSDPADIPTLITAFKVESLAATQRRRMR
jgi:hypothetical protein